MTGNPVTLIDGRTVSSWSEDWRHECEACQILAWPLSKRRAFLYGEPRMDGKRGPGIASIRGEDALKRLEAKMIELHEAGRASRGMG